MLATRGLGGADGCLVTGGLACYSTTVVITSIGGGRWRTETRKLPPEQALQDIQLAEDEEILAVIVLAVSEGLIP
jgi:hypothetical protein